MNITSAQYYTSNLDTSVNAGIEATIDGNVVHVPLDTANRHYQAILDWVAEGNTIADAD